MSTSTLSIQKKFAAALDGLIAQVKQDRSILAAILCGSLSHDTVWAKSDIDLALVTIDDKKVDREGSLSLDAWAKVLAGKAQAGGAVGAVKTSVVTFAGGKAVALSYYRASPNGPMNTSQYLFDGGSDAYDLVLVAPQSKEAKYLAALRHAAQTFKRS